MAYHALSREFLSFLRAHPEVRAQIRAAPNRTLLYAGSFVASMWQEIDDLKRRDRDLAEKETLSDVLGRIAMPGTSHPNFLSYFQGLQSNVPAKPDGFMLWRVVSGIFASQAEGAVSFQIGAGLSAEGKVFAATELGVLSRNPKVNEITRDLLAYFRRCIENGDTGINLGFISA